MLFIIFSAEGATFPYEFSSETCYNRSDLILSCTQWNSFPIVIFLEGRSDKKNLFYSRKIIVILYTIFQSIYFLNK